MPLSNSGKSDQSSSNSAHSSQRSSLTKLKPKGLADLKESSEVNRFNKRMLLKNDDIKNRLMQFNEQQYLDRKNGADKIVVMRNYNGGIILNPG